MGSRPRPKVRPLSTFGWSLTGALLIALSLPPVGFFPLAWVGLVPLLVRWSVRTPSVAYARELYALLLTTSCCIGFWVLFNPDAGMAARGGLSLFLVPIPLTASFVLSGVVRERYGVRLGLLALSANLLAAEYLVLHTSVDVPWLHLGHTQAGAVAFIQMADLGGVLLLSAWVLLLNVTAFLVLPQSERPGERYGERGISVAFFTTLVALPVAYGAVRTAQTDVPTGYARIGIVQPGVDPQTWAERDPTSKVDYLASLSDDLLRRWASDEPDTLGAGAGLRRERASLGLILWPQSSIPASPTAPRDEVLFERLEAWGQRRGVSLLTGAYVASSDSKTSGDVDASAALLLRPGKPVVRYDQMVGARYAGSGAEAGGERVLFGTPNARIAATVGFEALHGDHLRRFSLDGANLIVSLANHDLWGRSAGLYQHLQFTRLRAIEARRAVVVTSVGGVSALIQPNGTIDQLAGWMEQGTTSIDVPTYRGETFYVRHGDWLGVGAFAFAVVFQGVLALLSHFIPESVHRPAARRRPLAA